MEMIQKNSSFRDELNTIRALDINEYNKDVSKAKDKWFELATLEIGNMVKESLKRKVCEGDIRHEDGKNVLYIKEELYFSDGGYDVFSAEEKEGVVELHKHFARIPKHERENVDNFFDTFIVDSRPYVVHKFKKPFIKIFRNVHFFKISLGDVFVEFLKRLREHLMNDGIELISLSGYWGSVGFMEFRTFEETFNFKEKNRYISKNFAGFCDWNHKPKITCRMEL